jgi:chaperone required for assembly of F1-ATPase
MAAATPKRFYEKVAVAEVPGGNAILLDGRPVKTPARAPLLLPNASLAEAVAEEWRAQGAQIRPDTMPLTKFAYTAIDRVATNRKDVIGQIVTDLLCYRAGSPPDLVQRQSHVWDPFLNWADEALGARLCAGEGVAYIEQPEAAALALERAVSQSDSFELAGLHAAVSLLGSLVLALALRDGRVDPDGAFRAAAGSEGRGACRRRTVSPPGPKPEGPRPNLTPSHLSLGSRHEGKSPEATGGRGKMPWMSSRSAQARARRANAR